MSTVYRLLPTMCVVIGLSSAAFSQTEEPLSTVEVGISDVPGVWEGYTSAGALLYVEITANADGRLTAMVQTYWYGPTEGPTTNVSVMEVEVLTATQMRFRNLAAATTIAAFWYGRDAVRLVFDDGTVAIMARIINTDAASSGNPFAALPSVTPPPEAEALLRALEGSWEGRSTVLDPSFPQETAATIRIVDIPSGRFTLSASAGGDTSIHYFQVVSATSDSLMVRTPDMYDVPWRIKFSDPEHIEVVWAGASQMELARVSAPPAD